MPFFSVNHQYRPCSEHLVSFTSSICKKSLFSLTGDIPPSDLTPTSGSDECASWKNIENALEFSFEEGYSVSDCVTLPGCRGFNCSAMYDVSFHLFNVTQLLH